MKQKIILHIDMNSFFATCEQQANALIRGIPVGVVAYPSNASILLAASIEAKQRGIKTGVSAREAKALFPTIVLLENDPPKYRAISECVSNILADYSDRIEPYSIDESFMDLTGWAHSFAEARAMAQHIKQRIRAEIGSYLTCSIGISTTKFLAKVGSDMKKPDGLTIITPNDLPSIYTNVELTDLWGVATGWKIRLARIGITTIYELYNYPLQNLVTLFGKPGYSLYANIHGIEHASVAQSDPLPKSISHQYAIPRFENTPNNIPKILMKLCEKVGRRLRKQQLVSHTIFVSVRLHKARGVIVQKKLPYPIRGTLDIYHHAAQLLQQLQLRHTIRVLSIGVSSLIPTQNQLSLFNTIPSSLSLPACRERGQGRGRGGAPKNNTNSTTRTSCPSPQPSPKGEGVSIDDIMDTIKDKHGDYAITHGTMTGGNRFVPDRIGFGKSFRIIDSRARL